MKLSPKRHHEILNAIFCHLVKKDLLEKNFIKKNDGADTDLDELISLARLLDCQPHVLQIAIDLAVYKIKNLKLPANSFKDLDEEQQVTEAMICVLEHKLSNLHTRLVSFQQSIHNLAEALNKNDRELDLMSSELAAFLGPLYLKVVTETFDRLKLIPNF